MKDSPKSRGPAWVANILVCCGIEEERRTKVFIFETFFRSDWGVVQATKCKKKWKGGGLTGLASLLADVVAKDGHISVWCSCETMV